MQRHLKLRFSWQSKLPLTHQVKLCIFRPNISSGGKPNGQCFRCLPVNRRPNVIFGDSLILKMNFHVAQSFFWGEWTHYLRRYSCRCCKCLWRADIGRPAFSSSPPRRGPPSPSTGSRPPAGSGSRPLRNCTCCKTNKTLETNTTSDPSLRHQRSVDFSLPIFKCFFVFFKTVISSHFHTRTQKKSLFHARGGPGTRSTAHRPHILEINNGNGNRSQNRHGKEREGERRNVEKAWSALFYLRSWPLSSDATSSIWTWSHSWQKAKQKAHKMKMQAPRSLKWSEVKWSGGTTATMSLPCVPLPPFVDDPYSF